MAVHFLSTLAEITLTMSVVILLLLALGPLLGHVHLHDSHPAIHMALGDGDLPLEDYLLRLEEWGYRGLYAFEFNDSRYRQDPARADGQSVAWLRERGFF